MEKERKVKKYSVIALVVALLGLTIVYAAISVTLNINATARANKTGINVVFEKIQGVTPSKSSGVITTLDDPEVKQSGTVLNMGDITLNEPGDYYQYSINIVNKGKKAAKVTGIDKPNVTELDEDNHNGFYALLSLYGTVTIDIAVSQQSIIEANLSQINKSSNVTINYVN